MLGLDGEGIWGFFFRELGREGWGWFDGVGRKSALFAVLERLLAYFTIHIYDLDHMGKGCRRLPKICSCSFQSS